MECLSARTCFQPSKISYRRRHRPNSQRVLKVMLSTSEIQYKERVVTVQNSRNQRLVGKWIPGTASKTVILCHGYSDHKDMPINLAFAEKLATTELSSLRFDFSGNGESEGDFQFGNYWEEVDDIRTFVEHLRNENAEIVALVGKVKALLY